MMGEADIAAVTRDGTRWELTFQGDDKFRLTVAHLLDVMKLLTAHIEILGDGEQQRANDK